MENDEITKYWIFRRKYKVSQKITNAILPLNDIRFSTPTKHHTLFPYSTFLSLSPLSSRILFSSVRNLFPSPLFFTSTTIISRFNVLETSENLQGTRRRRQKGWLRYLTKSRNCGAKVSLFEESNYIPVELYKIGREGGNTAGACKSRLTSGRVCMRRDDTNKRGNFQISSGDNGRFPGRDYDIATPRQVASPPIQSLQRRFYRECDREPDKNGISNSTTVEFR